MPPTLDEIARLVGPKSRGSVANHVKAPADKAFAVIEPNKRRVFGLWRG